MNQDHFRSTEEFPFLNGFNADLSNRYSKSENENKSEPQDSLEQKQSHIR